ncbi:hypothetical protein F444_08873 [Phytophthora nicotianae P1976]|uniref:Uncharacterized protein n=1 Tax=Phytophthora nicotianae P1976 TaxID=1317066 RepID=A0A081A9K7_PHYNI|nr:hypothetical protein F444_08873 [Phytophthora nicotianae P1976]
MANQFAVYPRNCQGGDGGISARMGGRTVPVGKVSDLSARSDQLFVRFD